MSWQPADKLDVQTAIHAYQLSHGYDSQLLSPYQVEARVPGINPEAIPASGAMWNPGEGWVDLPSLINYLAEELLGLGSELMPGTQASTW